MHKYNVILNKTVTKLATIFTKCFFSYLNPSSYLKKLSTLLIDNFLNFTILRSRSLNLLK